MRNGFAPLSSQELLQYLESNVRCPKITCFFFSSQFFSDFRVCPLCGKLEALIENTAGAMIYGDFAQLS